jgi:hypothetical protein
LVGKTLVNISGRWTGNCSWNVSNAVIQVLTNRDSSAGKHSMVKDVIACFYHNEFNPVMYLKSFYYWLFSQDQYVSYSRLNPIWAVAGLIGRFSIR